MATEAPNKEASRPHDIFISYSRKDKEFVRRLDGELARRGREAWVDWESIRPTEEFMQAIYGAIEGADTFVFVPHARCRCLGGVQARDRARNCAQQTNGSDRRTRGGCADCS